MIGVGNAAVIGSRGAALGERAGAFIMVDTTKYVTDVGSSELLGPVLARRDSAVVAWFTHVRTRLDEAALRVLELAQEGRTREQIAGELGGVVIVEAGIRAIVGSIEVIEADGALAVRLGMRNVRVCLARLPAFAGAVKVVARPGLAALLLERLGSLEEVS